MFKVLDYYIGKTILSTIALTLSMLVGLSAIIKYVEQLRSVGQGTYTLFKALQFVVYSVPGDIEIFFPMAVLLGALIGLGMLASSSELVVMQAAGVSKLQIGLSVLKTAIPLILIIMCMGQWGAPQAVKKAYEIRTVARSGGQMLSSQSSVWAKDGNDFIYIAHVDGKANMSGITVWHFNKDDKLDKTVFAKSAHYNGGDQWTMKDITQTTVTSDRIIKESLPSQSWTTALTPSKLAVVTVKPENLPISGIYEYVQYLKASKQDPSRYELAFWRKVFQPISIAVMLLLALSFVFGPLRSVTMGARILSGVIFGFVFYVSDSVFGPMSLVYGISPIIGALAPSLLFLVVTLYLLRRKL